MKSKGIYPLILVYLVMLGGCSLSETHYKEDTEVVREEKIEMTEQQEAVFRSYGLSEDEIAKMKEEGMNYSQQSFVDTAIIMLNHLEEKYGQTFEVVGGDIPGLFSDAYWITAQACEGEHAGKRFDVYFNGEQGITDGYITILKEQEAVEALKNLVHKQFSDINVYASIYGEYGDYIKMDMTGGELLKTVSYDAICVIAAPDMTEEEFLLRVKELEKYLKDNNVFVGGFLYCFYNEIDPDLPLSKISSLISTGLDTNDVFKWREYIFTN